MFIREHVTDDIEAGKQIGLRHHYRIKNPEYKMDIPIFTKKSDNKSVKGTMAELTSICKSCFLNPKINSQYKDCHQWLLSVLWEPLPYETRELRYMGLIFTTVHDLRKGNNGLLLAIINIIMNDYKAGYNHFVLGNISVVIHAQKYNRLHRYFQESIERFLFRNTFDKIPEMVM